MIKNKKVSVHDLLNAPEDGKQYLLVGGPKDKCIANGNTWEESEVKEVSDEAS